MSIQKRFILLILTATLLPICIIGTLGYVLIRNTATRMLDQTADSLLDDQFELLARKVQEKATRIDVFLEDYHSDLVLLRNLATRIIDEYPNLNTAYLRNLYPDKDTAGLPGYGYVSPLNGAYANWDLVNYRGSPWIRKAVVDRIRNDIAFRAQATRKLDQIMSLAPVMQQIHEKHQATCELVWVVTRMGIAASYPNNYQASLDKNPDFMFLDESQQDYVRMFDARNNPRRELRWMKSYLDAIKKIWMTSCVAPLYDREEFIGTIGFDVLLNKLTAEFQNEPIGKEGYVFLLTSEGIPLALPEQGIRDFCGDHPQGRILRNIFQLSTEKEKEAELTIPALQEISTPEGKRILQSVLSGNSEIQTFRVQDQEKVLLSRHIPETQWYVGVVSNLNEIQQPIFQSQDALNVLLKNSLLTFGLLVLVTALGAGMMGSYLGHRTTKPISRLIGEIEQIGQGEEWHTVSSGTHDEFENLANSVNRMVATIQEKESRFRAIFNNVSDAIFIHDAETGSILEVNQRTLELFRYTQEEILEKDIGQLSENVPPYTQQDALAWLDKARRAENPIFLWRSRKSDGECFWADISMNLAEVGGQRRIIVSVRDVSERVRIEEEKARLEEHYRQSQKMEAIGQLTGGVAHDFNNLLHVINGVSHMIRMDMDPTHKDYEMLGEIIKAGERAARLVSQLLLFSRRQIIRPEILDLNDVISNLLQMVTRVIGEHVQLTWIPGIIKGRIHADPGMIEQCLLNLCINARDAMPDGGFLTIKTEECEFDEDYCATSTWAKPGRYVTLIVSDTGQGMSKEVMEHIFEPFFTTKEMGKGTGLGLSTVYGIIKQHGGMITVYSEPGEGAQFKLYWPLTEEERTESQPLQEIKVVGGNETILLVEDDEAVRNLSQSILESTGYRVLAARDGLEAVDLFKENPERIDLAIMDVVMPRMGGREAYEKMREVRPDLKVIFASGYSQDAIHNNFILDKGLVLIEKPFNYNLMLQTMRMVLDGSNV